MSRFGIVVSVLSVAAWSIVAGAQSAPSSSPAAAAADSAPASAPSSASAPTSAASGPTSASVPVVKVGDTVIKSERITKILALLPPVISEEEYEQSARAGVKPRGITAQQFSAAADAIAQQMIFRELARAYLDAKKIPAVTDEELANEKAAAAKAAAAQGVTLEQLMTAKGVDDEAIRDELRVQKLIRQIASKENVEQYVKDHPAYFNGTKVRASHILLECEPYAPTAVQLEVLKKLNGIANDIRSGKITFEDAAKQYSACPSGKKGGDLDEFTFDRMVPSFARVAFNMKVGDVSGIVRTEYGFHLIKVTVRTDATGPAPASAPELAWKTMLSEVQDEVLAQILTTCPISKP